MTKFKSRDRVMWRTPLGLSHGEIVKRITSDTTCDGVNVTASRDDPRYIVRDRASGRLIAHTPDSLQKL